VALAPSGGQSNEPAVSPRTPVQTVSIAHRFLRTSSNNLGSAIDKVLNVQGSLDEMEHELTGEYNKWKSRERALVGERDDLRADVARLQTMLADQKKLQEKEYSLQNEHALLRLENEKAVGDHKDARTKWATLRQALVQKVHELESQTPGTQGAAAWAESAAANQTSQIRAENHALQLHIGDLTAQNQQVQNTMAERSAKFKSTRESLLSKILTVQEQIHSMQGELVLKARLTQEALALQQKLTLQSTTLAQMHKDLIDYQGNCTANSTKMENQIRTVLQAEATAKKDYSSCQALEGENQVLQGRLTSCHSRAR